MKFRWVVLIIAVTIAVYMLIDVVAALFYYDSVFASVRNTVAIAAEQAVAQVMASDELFTADEQTMQSRYKNMENGTVYYAEGVADKYTVKSLYDVAFNTTEREEVIKIFGKDILDYGSTYMQALCNITTDIGGCNVPNIARMGLLGLNVADLNTIQRVSITTLEKAVADSGYVASKQKFNDTDWLDIYTLEKANTNSKGQKETYYLAPTNIGITYLNADLLQNAFLSNMDVLMRGKLNESGNLSEGLGVPSTLFNGEDYVINDATKETIKKYNIITNQQFAFVKGVDRTLLSGYGGFSGSPAKNGLYCMPDVTYKVVDVCQPENETIVRMAVSEIAGVSNWENYKAWLEGQGIDTTKPHYCVIAQVIFYIDIIVPYSTPLERNLYSIYNRTEETQVNANEFFQLTVDTNTGFFSTVDESKVSKLTGNPFYTYTVYTALMP